MEKSIKTEESWEVRKARKEGKMIIPLTNQHNNVIIIGVLTADATAQYMGDNIGTLTKATIINNYFSRVSLSADGNPEGEKHVPNQVTIGVECWGSVDHKSMKKGTEVVVTGRLAQRSFPDENIKGGILKHIIIAESIGTSINPAIPRNKNPDHDRLDIKTHI